MPKPFAIHLAAVSIAALTAKNYVNGFVFQKGSLPSSMVAPTPSYRTALHVSMFQDSGMERRTSPSAKNSEVAGSHRVHQEREIRIPLKFASGDELYELRDRVVESKQELVNARVQYNGSTTNDERVEALTRINELQKEIDQLNGRDAEFMYAVSSERMAKATADMNSRLAEQYSVQMEEARSSIPQLNMHGLWVGKYGEYGYELINVTYSGDTLIATKVTGDKNVPKGEITFTVDLAPRISNTMQPAHATNIEPIELNPQEERQWGKQFLPRYLGKGQDASENFKDAQWMDGQMILVGKWFSFTWMPLGRQIFFGRPSSEVIMKMLKDAEEDESKQDEVAAMRNIAQNMMEETYWFKKDDDVCFGEVECFE